MQTRRQFLFTLLAGSFFSATTYALPYKTVNYLSITDKLLLLFSNNDSAVVIGKTYQIFSEKTSKNLSSEIFTLLNYLHLSKEDILNTNNSQLLQHIKSTIEQDFEKGNIELVDGWYLSKTEVQLCYVLSLCSPRT